MFSAIVEKMQTCFADADLLFVAALNDLLIVPARAGSWFACICAECSAQLLSEGDCCRRRLYQK
jgi:hypothetical protein